jgi:hypothetical protein
MESRCAARAGSDMDSLAVAYLSGVAAGVLLAEVVMWWGRR